MSATRRTRNRAESINAVSALQQQSDHNRANAAAEASIAYETRALVEDIRPKNTIYAYLPKQAKYTVSKPTICSTYLLLFTDIFWKQWCVENNYENNLVTELKIVRYVKSILEKGNTRSATNADGTEMTVRTSYSHETLKMHIKALIDLHNKQKAEYQGVMALNHPRGPVLKSFEGTLKHVCSVARQTEDFVDPGINSIQDGYDGDQLVLVADYYLQKKKMAGEALRDRMTFLLNHMMMLRGETLRDTNLNHLFTLEYKDEGATRCPVFVMMITGGKTNQEHQKLYSGVIRHKNVQTCAFGAVGFYLFHRFHIKGEAFPDFSMNQNWFKTKLTRGREAHKSVSYNTQLNSVNTAFAALGITSVKKTHSGRQAGAREAEMAGLSQDHIRRVGQWNRESMENNYLTCLPRVAIRVIQGFPEEKGCFWLPRALVSPPLSLQKKIFPSVEEWQQKMQEDPTCQTICGEGFLKLLIELRVIILQDAVLLKQIAPDHEMFSHEVFQSSEFRSYSEALIRAMNNTTPPAEVQIQRVLPEINSRISELASQIQASSRVSRNPEPINQDLVDAIMERFEERFGASFANSVAGSNSGTSNAAATVVENRRRTRDDDEDVGDGTQKRYKLSRDISNVTSLWREWTVGLGSDQPSVNSLNEEFGCKWRKDAKGKLKYNSVNILRVCILTSFCRAKILLQKTGYSERSQESCH